MRPLLVLLGLVLAAAAFAGCIQNNGDAGPDEATGGWTGRSEYGVKMNEVTLHERITPGASTTWVFQAANLASSSNPVEYDAACAGPFQVTLIGIYGRELQYEGPRADCQAIDMRVLDAGETLDHSWTWDGRIWSDTGKMTALAGTYTIRVAFEGYHNGNREHVTDGALGETTVYVEGD